MRKHIILFVVLLILGNKLLAQFSLATEYEYIRHINQQRQPALVLDNIRNAEQAIRPFLFNDSLVNEFEVPLLNQLSYSYFLTYNYSQAFWYLHLRQHLYPEVPISDFEKKMATVCTQKLKLTSKTADILKTKTEMQLHQQHLNAIQEAIRWQEYDLFSVILAHALYLAQTSSQALPLWLDQWVFLNTLEIRPKYQLSLINFTLMSGNAMDIYNAENSRAKLILLKKSFRFFMKNEMMTEAKYVLDILETCPKNHPILKNTWTKRYNHKMRKTRHTAF